MSDLQSKRPGASGKSSAEVRSLELNSWKDYYLIIRERFLIGVIMSLLVCGTVGYLLLKQPPVYSSTASIILADQREHVLDIPQVVETGLEGGQRLWRISLENHINQLRSRSFRGYVVDSFTEEEADLILRAYQDDDEPLSLRGAAGEITVEAVLDSFIISVSAGHRDPEAAALIANRYVERYIEFNNERTQSGNQSAIAFLREREMELREKVDVSEQELQEYRREKNLVSVEENADLLAQRMAAVNESLTQVRVERIRLESKMRQVELFQNEDRNLLELFSLSSLGNTPQVVSELDGLRNDREVMSERYGSQHPAMLANQRAIDVAEELIRENIQLAIADLRNQLSQVSEHEQDLRAELRELEQESLEMDRVKIRFASLQRGLIAVRNTHSQILDRLDETLITSQMENSAIRVFDHATPSSRPKEPNLTRIGMLVAFLGGFFFFGTPIGLAVLDNKMKRARDVEDLLDQKLLGEISSVSHLKRNLRPHVVAEESDDRAAEGFRGLFSQIQLTSQRTYPKVMLITSTIPGEGKSFIVNNLASCFAAHGKRTLMIDFDLRRPSLHRFHERLNNNGMLQWLDHKDSASRDPSGDELNIFEVGPDLFLLSSGGQTKKATETIGLPAIDRMLAVLRRRFDVIILDTPPLGVFPDALPLARLADESMFVVAFGKVDRQQVKTSVVRLAEAHSNLLGVVMNSMPKGARFSHYYSGCGFGNSEYAKYYSQKE